MIKKMRFSVFLLAVLSFTAMSVTAAEQARPAKATANKVKAKSSGKTREVKEGDGCVPFRISIA